MSEKVELCDLFWIVLFGLFRVTGGKIESVSDFIPTRDQEKIFEDFHDQVLLLHSNRKSNAIQTGLHLITTSTLLVLVARQRYCN